MNCASCDEMLVAYIDGELTKPAEDVIRAHLDGCADCRSLLADYRAVRASLGLWPDATPTDRVDQRVLSRVGELGKQRQTRSEDAELLDKMRWWWLLPVVLATVFGAGFILANPWVRVYLGSLLDGLATNLVNVVLPIAVTAVVVSAIAFLVVLLARRRERPPSR